MEVREEYRFVVAAEDQAAAGRAAQELADALRETEGVLEADLRKADGATMDLEATVGVVATSGAASAIAQGLAAWLRARGGVTVEIQQEGKAGTIKAAFRGVDPATAERTIKAIREG